jgi:hypothetical protein
MALKSGQQARCPLFPADTQPRCSYFRIRGKQKQGAAYYMATLMRCRYLLCLLLVLVSLQANAQNPVQVSGQVQADKPGYDVTGRSVKVKADSALGNAVDSFQVDSAGMFGGLINVADDDSGRLTASITTCDNQINRQAVLITADSGAQVSFRLNACPKDTLVLIGTLASDDAGYSLSNRSITVKQSLSSGGAISTVTTDQAGNFRDTFLVPGSARDTVGVRATTCNGDTVQDQQVVDIDSAQQASFNGLNICPRLADLRLSGSVEQPQGQARTAQVYLYQHRQATGSQPALQLVDSTALNTDNGRYTFTGVAPDTYTLRAMPLSAAPDSADYMPTYFRSNSIVPGAVSWRNADSITLSTRDVDTAMINLHTNRDPDGPGFISGYVYNGGFEDREDPDAGAMVVLLDQNQNPVAFQRTDSVGFYEFPNIPLRTYYVRVEAPGKPSEQYQLSLSDNDLSTTGIIFQVNENEIRVRKLPGTTALPEQSEPRFTRIYPNPVQEQLNIKTKSSSGHMVTVTLHTIQGRKVYQQPISTDQPSAYHTINMRPYPDGIYLIRLSSGSTVVTRKVIKE